MNTRRQLKTAVKKAIKELQKQGKLKDVKIPAFSVERPVRSDHGDYAVSVAMQLASAINRKPKTLAKLITAELNKDPKIKKMFSAVQVASPGFINFFLSRAHAKKILWNNFLETDLNFSRGKSKKINIEFGSINPTGPLHVGHARTFFYGDVLANIFEAAGHKVTGEYYVNNARQSSQIKELGKTALGKGTSYKGPYLDKKIKEHKKALKRFKNPEAAGHYIAGKIQKDNRAILENKAGISFDVWFSEEDLYKKREIKKTLAELEKRNLVYENEGATWLKTTKYGDSQDQVLVRSTGENTYFLSDIAYHINKSKRKFDKLIDVWGADHHGHLKRMRAAMQIFKVKNLEILIAQFVRLKGGAKLSKRQGNIVSIEDLIDAVGLDAARYFYLTKSLDSQMEFDLKLAKERSKQNPLFYIQYTYARSCSILRKSEIRNTKSETNSNFQISKKQLNNLKEPGEVELIRKLIQFPEVLEDITEDYQVHRLTNYLLELAREFNQFYRDYKVIGENEEIEKARLVLVAASAATMRQCLDLLGINAPAKV